MTFFRVILIGCLLLILMDSFSQVDTTRLKVLSNDKQEIDNQKDADIIDFLRIKRRNEELEKSSKKTMKPRATFVPFIGYTLQTRLAGILAGNLAFYSDDLDGRNQSAISTSISYSQNKQIIIPVLSNIWTKRNRYNILGNWRYYKYPEQTFGLGGHTGLKNKTKLDYQYFLFRESVLRHVSNSAFYLGLGYNLSYHANIIQNPSLSGELTDFDKYGRTKKSCSSGLSIHALFDNRGNTINPLKGAYVNLTFYHYAKFLASDNNWDALILDMRKYLKLGKAKNVLAIWSYNWFTFGGKRPYLDLPSTGWDAYSNIGRGYIQSRLRGENLMYLELEYRFKISHNGLLGGVLFTNAQSVSDWPSNKFTTIFPAVGTGIRIKLNKFSGTNLAIDYGFGLQGSQGLFINIAEIF